MDNTSSIKPLPLRKALLFFGVPAAVVVLIVYVVMPLLAERGVPIFFNYMLVYATAPMLALIAASLIGYRREGNAVSWPALKNRFRLDAMKGKAWPWAIGLTLFMILFAPWNLLAILPGSLALSFVAQRLKNTWPAVIAHGLASGLLVVIVVVMGIAS